MRVEAPKESKFARLRRFELPARDDVCRGDRRIGVGDSPTPPVVSIWANAVEDVTIGVGPPPRAREVAVVEPTASVAVLVR